MSTTQVGNVLRFAAGSGANDNDVVFQTGDVTAYDEYQLHSTAGAMDVFVTLDGTNYTTAPLSLIDQGATTNDPVIVTSAGTLFGFYGTFAKVRVLQNGATAVANATLVCSRKGGTR